MRRENKLIILEENECVRSEIDREQYVDEGAILVELPNQNIHDIVYHVYMSAGSVIKITTPLEEAIKDCMESKAVDAPMTHKPKKSMDPEDSLAFEKITKRKQGKKK